ncbi:MAG: HTTM domain-containing protein, partial [Planctomycetaceae bacterium]|nr:HTTM domain-containing protein [Planctomycetaceae bacterium]
WVEALDGNGMVQVYVLMAFAAIGVGLGLFYRLSALVLFLTYTYTFLAEEAMYLDRYYLMSLITFLLVLIPANRSFSLDAAIFPEKASSFIPNWCRWVLMFVVALPSVYGGIAKLNSDWLHGMPVGAWISMKSDLPVIGPMLTERWAAWVVSYVGLLVDFCIVPLLMWRKTRLIAYVAVALFYGMNSLLFSMDLYPWMMILLTTIFFDPNWPRKLLKRPLPRSLDSLTLAPRTLTQRLTIGIVGVFVIWQLVFPFRHFVYAGNPSWTEEGQLFAWRMMLRRKEVFARFYATDGMTGTVVEIPYDMMLTERQIADVAISPERIVEVVPFFEERAIRTGMKQVEIRAVVIASLNGRKPQLLIDPDLDLLTVKRTWGHQPWIKPLTEPFRSEPWDVPSDEWPEVLGIELPEAINPVVDQPPGAGEQGGHDHSHEGHDHEHTPSRGNAIE